MSFVSYLTNCLQNDKLIRWADNCMPLKVYVAPFRWYKEKGQEYFYYAMIKDAFEIWKNASGGKLSFEFVDNLYNSQINIEWKRVDRKSLGHCLYNFDPRGRLFSAEIEIGLSDGLLHRQYEDKNEVNHTIIHEIGHALGLKHSPYTDDIMYVPHQYGTAAVSKKDKTTLKWLYNFPVDVTKNDILLRYNFSSEYTLDHLVYFLENPEQGGSEKAENSSEQSRDKTILREKTPEAQEEKVLHYEQDTLAELNKYNLSLQNITVSPNMREYLKKVRIQKDLGKE